MALFDYVSKTNKIYYAAGIEWQKGETIDLNINLNELKGRWSTKSESDVTKSSAKMQMQYIQSKLRNFKKYSRKQYYIVVLPDHLFDDYLNKEGVEGFIIAKNNAMDDNVLYIRESNTDLNVPAHELGHCNGLNEFAIDYYKANKNYEYDERTKNTTNIMGYAIFRCDFKIDQIKRIRQNIKTRITK